MKRLLALLLVLLTFQAVWAQTNSNTPKRQRALSMPSTAVSAQQAAQMLQATQHALEASDAPIQISKRQLSGTVDIDVARGYKALGLNQFSQAREAYNQVLQRTPTHRDALIGIAYAHQALGDTTQAIATLRRVLELYPRDSEASSAMYLIGGGEPLAQESKLKQLLERTERPAPLHYALGVLMYDQQRFGESERAFDRAFALEPEQPDYAYNLALALDRLGRSREAARQYVVALNLANHTSAVFSRDLARARLRVLTAK